MNGLEAQWEQFQRSQRALEVETPLHVALSAGERAQAAECERLQHLYYEHQGDGLSLGCEIGQGLHGFWQSVPDAALEEIGWDDSARWFRLTHGTALPFLNAAARLLAACLAEQVIFERETRR